MANGHPFQVDSGDDTTLSSSHINLVAHFQRGDDTQTEVEAKHTVTTRRRPHPQVSQLRRNDLTLFASV